MADNVYRTSFPRRSDYTIPGEEGAQHEDYLVSVEFDDDIPRSRTKSDRKVD